MNEHCSYNQWIKKLFAAEQTKRTDELNNIIIRVDAGRIDGLSFGHLSRMLVLDAIIQNTRNTQSLFLMKNYQEGIQQAKTKGVKVKTLPVAIDTAKEQTLILDEIKAVAADWLIIDLPQENFEDAFYRQVGSLGCKIFYVDDACFKTPPVDVINNSSILADNNTNRRTDQQTQYFLGPDYFVVDEDEMNCEAVCKANVFNVVISFGGSDPSGLTLKATHALLIKDWPNTLFRIVLGPGFADADIVNALVSNRTDIEVIVNPQNLIAVLKGSDLTICAGGRTLYELYYLNKRCYPIATAKHEAETILEFRKKGLINYSMIEWSDSLFIDQLELIISAKNKM